MRNPLRSEGEAFGFLLVVIVGAAVIAGAAALSTWVGVAAAVVVVGGIAFWLRTPPKAMDEPAEPVVPPAPDGARRVLLLAPAGAAVAELRERVSARLAGRDAEVLVLVPALSTDLEALTGAVDDRRDDAQHEADRLAAQLAAAGIRARGSVGADDPLLAVEDALRAFGADEVVLVGGDELLAHVQERVAVPVSLLA
jgi:hypothetical protein